MHPLDSLSLQPEHRQALYIKHHIEIAMLEDNRASHRLPINIPYSEYDNNNSGTIFEENRKLLEEKGFVIAEDRDAAACRRINANGVLSVTKWYTISW